MYNRLEPYLAQVEARLKHLPGERRAEEIQEMRQHMEALVTAHQELGLSEEEAIVATLRQFGSARTVSRELSHALQRAEKPLPGSLGIAMLCQMAGMWGGAYGLFHLLFVVQTDGLHPRFFANNSAVLIGWTILLGWSFLCLGSGLMTGLASPRKALTGIALAYGITILASFCSLVASRHPHSVPTHLRWYITTYGVWGLALAISMLGAKTGVWWRRKRDSRRPAIA